MSRINDHVYLHRVAQAAKQQAIRAGKLETADSIEVLYRRSHSDARLRYLLLKILRHRHMIGKGEHIEFLAYVYMSKRLPRIKSSSTRTTRNSQGLRLPYVGKKNIHTLTHTFTIQPSRLLALPPELRELIYGYALGPNRHDGTLIISRENIKNRIGLLGTCRQIRSEASPIFYHPSTRFEAVVNADALEPVVAWFKSIGVQTCKRLRSVSLRHELPTKHKTGYRDTNTVPLSGCLVGSIYMAQQALAPPLVRALLICGLPPASISTPQSESANYSKPQQLEFLTSLTDANWSREVSIAIARPPTSN
ncbi:hypothetical protein AC578_6276 [Pseudocercospora eumusae]|uniref:F-box domain-containing protein n=1 Tax=Pseudocercospora eumusae TaxID=321146 RepID=A0A139H6Z1_9PEZI|nr:hypothetical protein AC578_6276 [Pseudocercospora eumusae]